MVVMALGLLTAAAGERWHDVVRHALGQGYGGLENLALIPGSAGAAPIQNIGAYGVELADRFVALRALDLDTGRTFTFERQACRFDYRDSRFKQPDGARLVVVELTLRLSREPSLRLEYPDVARELALLGRSRPTAVDVAEAVVRVRRRKLPDPPLHRQRRQFLQEPAGAGRCRSAAGRARDRSGDACRRPGARSNWRQVS
jgi:UDP-N-acetylmuramate dehydrogenase